MDFESFKYCSMENRTMFLEQLQYVHDTLIMIICLCTHVCSHTGTQRYPQVGVLQGVPVAGYLFLTL